MNDSVLLKKKNLNISKITGEKHMIISDQDFEKFDNDSLQKLLTIKN